MKSKYILWGAVAVLVLVILVLAFKPAGAKVEDVDAAGVQAAIDAGAQVIDVRTAGEYQMGHIPKAVNVPVDQVEAAAQAWDKEATYVVYCATGSRSTTAVQSMQAMGFQDIKHFAAGIQAWNGQLEQGAASSSQQIQTSGKPVLIEFYTDS